MATLTIPLILGLILLSIGLDHYDEFMQRNH